MSSNKITVITQPKNRIMINNSQKAQIKNVTTPVTINKLAQMLDVDASSIDNNETVVYDEVSGKFVVKELPIINGGTF
jgi:hypothetical protein